MVFLKPQILLNNDGDGSGGAAAEVAASAEVPETTDTDAVASTDEGAEPIALNYKNIVKEGSEFVWKVDPDDPTAAIFKGNTLDELMDNAAKGIKAKDANYRTLKETKVNLSARAQERSQVEQEVELPSVEEILVDQMTKNRLDPKFLAYTEDDWSKLEAEKGAVGTLRIMNQVEQVKQQAQQLYARQNVVILNNRNLDAETEAVEDLVADYGVGLTADEYTEILEEIEGNDKNFERNGLRKPGRIVKLAAKKLSEKTKGATTADLKRRADEAAANARSEAGAAERHPAKPAGGAKPSTEKEFKSTNDAAASVRAAVAAGKLKL